MNRRALVITATLGLGLAGFVGSEFRARQRIRAEADALAQHVHQLADEATRLKQQRDATARELAEAERQLAALPALKANDKILATGPRAEISAWLAKVKRLRGFFEARPEQRIPEMQSLTEDDWLRAAKTADLEGEENVRAAMAEMRSVAIKAFLSRLGPRSVVT